MARIMNVVSDLLLAGSAVIVVTGLMSVLALMLGCCTK